MAKKPPVVRSLAGLRAVLFDELDRMRRGKTNAANANAFARKVRARLSSLESQENSEVEVAEGIWGYMGAVAAPSDGCKLPRIVSIRDTFLLVGRIIQ
jgi:hypothetical protein